MSLGGAATADRGRVGGGGPRRGRPRLPVGEVWEWTASRFEPYPGFAADPYADYSRPWFGTHRVVRGASFATRRRLAHPKYRNFFRPERDDIFCGFRSCAW